LVWWAAGEDDKLSKAAAAEIAVQTEPGSIVVSAITAWEVAMLVRSGRLALSMDLSTWLMTIGQIEAVRYVPVDNTIAILSTDLPGAFHKDPADRLIVATALALGATLLTADERILGYPNVRSLW
jgi:PIN domain nuclease of toxin-antitoxin system